MSAEHRELLQAVRAAPDDLQPRLVLADLLVGRGDPRGAFINAQCRLAGRGLSPAARQTLKKQADDLLKAHGDKWAAPALDMDAAYEFRLGFLSKLMGDIDRVLDNWPALRAVEPVVHVELRDATEKSMERLAGSELLTDIRHLTIRGDIGDGGVMALASADLHTVERLNLKDVEMTDLGLAALARARGFRPLRLTLTGNPITDDGAKILAESDMVERLERLFLSRTQLTDEGVAALAGSRRLGALRDLALGSVEELGDDGVDALIASPYLTSLRYVEVNSCWELSMEAVDRLEARFERVKAG